MATTSAVVVGAVAALGTVGANLAGGGHGTSAGSAPAHLKIPADLRLPHEGETGWHVDDDAAIPAVFAGCGAGAPAMTGRTDVRGAAGPGRPVEEGHSPTRVTEQLMLFDSDLAAQSAMAALVAQGQACGWIDPGMGRQLDATRLTGEYPDAELLRVAGIRAGNAIFVISATTRGALMSSVGGDELSLIAARLCTVLSLCDPAPGVSPLSGGSAGSPQPTGSPGSADPSGPPASRSAGSPQPIGSPGSADPSGPPASPGPGTASPILPSAGRSD